MPETRIISDPEDSSPRPATRTLVDALEKLRDRKEISEATQLRLLTCPSNDRFAWFSALSFKSTKGDDVFFALPISQGCRAYDTLGNPVYLTLDRLDDSEVDSDGNILLRDGTHIHAVAFDTLSLHFELPELEETVVYLTIRYLGAEQRCFRRDDCFVGIDYAALRQLCVPSVKSLARYVNAKIGEIERRDGALPFQNVSLATVQRALDLAGIGKVRGRLKRGNWPATVQPQSNRESKSR
jgi:hypothetical protein